jgi:4-hydroxy-2-oxoheptanedioate aldolase
MRKEDSMKLRPSRVLARLRSGEVASCVRLNLSEPRVAEIAAMCDFDCLWVDMEHAPNTLKDVENQVRAAKAYDVDMLVRVTRGSYSDLNHPFEMDAAGIMVPHVMSTADAQEVVRQTRFHPVGRRPLDGGNADGAYCMIPTARYVREANEQRFLVVQIEDPEPLADLEEIAELPGIDVLFFGPGDFAQGIGAPGALDHPKVAEARERIARTARKHGKYAGTVGSIENLPSLIDMGYQFISVGADVVALADYFRGIAAAFRGQSTAPGRTARGGGER